jgi:hypothetical protein
MLTMIDGGNIIELFAAFYLIFNSMKNIFAQKAN